jgi:hypothetical protein
LYARRDDDIQKTFAQGDPGIQVVQDFLAFLRVKVAFGEIVGKLNRGSDQVGYPTGVTGIECRDEVAQDLGRRWTG